MPVRLANCTDQSSAADTPVSRASPNTVFVIDSPSDATALRVSCVDQDPARGKFFLWASYNQCSSNM